ncbi:MAG: hypothetical protein MI924_05475 [Chloroflexales bacterium]|nr:hypothetical protein [Chloroflexales bacterium]
MIAILAQLTNQHSKNVQSTEYSSGIIKGKPLATGFSLAIIGTVLWPIIENWRKEPQDNFPLSYYPMFSAKRSKRAEVTHLVGYDEQGQRSVLDYKYAGRGGMNQVRRQIRRLVAEGHAEKLCQSVAANIARRQNGSPSDIVTVQIVTSSYRLDRYFSGDKRPRSETVHAECHVEGVSE